MDVRGAYELLGLGGDVGRAAIQRAFRDLAREAQAEQDTERHRLLIEARSIALAQLEVDAEFSPTPPLTTRVEARWRGLGRWRRVVMVGVGYGAVAGTVTWWLAGEADSAGVPAVVPIGAGCYMGGWVLWSVWRELGRPRQQLTRWRFVDVPDDEDQAADLADRLEAEYEAQQQRPYRPGGIQRDSDRRG